MHFPVVTMTVVRDGALSGLIGTFLLSWYLWYEHFAYGTPTFLYILRNFPITVYKYGPRFACSFYLTKKIVAIKNTLGGSIVTTAVFSPIAVVSGVIFSLLINHAAPNINSYVPRVISGIAGAVSSFVTLVHMS